MRAAQRRADVTPRPSRGRLFEWKGRTPATHGAETCLSPIRCSERARSTSSSCRGLVRTSCSAGSSRAGATITARSPPSRGSSSSISAARASRTRVRRAHGRGANGRCPRGHGRGRLGPGCAIGSADGAAMAALYAATYPDRTAALILNNPFVRGRWAADYPWGTRDDPDSPGSLADGWGGRQAIEEQIAEDMPGRVGDEEFLRLMQSSNASAGVRPPSRSC